MSWLLKQAEDILNRVDQQTNAALHQNSPKIPPKQNQVEFIPETPAFTPPIKLDHQPVINRIPITQTRRIKKTNESDDLFDYLNRPTSTETKKSNRISSSNNRRTSSSSSVSTDDPPPSQNNTKELIVV